MMRISRRAIVTTLGMVGMLARGASAMEPIPPGGPGAGVLDTPAIEVASPEHVILDAAAVAGSRIVAAGEHGVIVVSDDDGVTWRQVPVPVNATITGLSFANPKTGYATGHFGTVLRTDDSGEHWRLLLDGRRVPMLMHEAAGDDARALRVAARAANDGPDKPFLEVSLSSPDQLIVFGASGIAVQSSDGGRHWADFSRHVEDPAGLNLYGVATFPGHALLLAGEQGLLVAGDPDKVLTKLASPYAGSFFGVLPMAGQHLLLYGLVGHAFLSSDAGAHWSEVHNKRSITLDAAIQRADGTVLVADGQGQILRLGQGTDKAAELVASGLRAPWPIAALCETPSHTLLAFGFGGVMRIPESRPVNG